MFQDLFRRAETTIDGIVAKYMGRALVAVPLIVACGFATAAATVKLVELYGAPIGCAIMALVFGVLGLLTMAVVSGGHHAPEETSFKAEEAEEPSRIGSEFEAFLTPELRSLVGATAPMALPVVARTVMRNLPLLIMLAVVIYIFSRFGRSSEEVEGDAPQAMATPPAA
jgi:Na+-transporting methylmalonyl-CoA/oxaloacetate decarboxylase gamma subunit